MLGAFPIWVVVLDYVLGAIMWTLIGRFAMGLFLPEDSSFFFMRFFVRSTDPLLRLFRPAQIKCLQAAPLLPSRDTGRHIRHSRLTIPPVLVSTFDVVEIGAGFHRRRITGPDNGDDELGSTRVGHVVDFMADVSERTQHVNLGRIAFR